MRDESDSREFMRRIAERSACPRRLVRRGEDLGTLMIGSLSVALGVVAFAAMTSSLLNKPMGDWNFRNAQGPLFMSSIATIVAIAGIALGYLGVRIGWKHGRRISVLSLVGLASSYLAVLISLILVIYHESRN